MTRGDGQKQEIKEGKKIKMEESIETRKCSK